MKCVMYSITLLLNIIYVDEFQVSEGFKRQFILADSWTVKSKI
jgi:hypothetical protein